MEKAELCFAAVWFPWAIGSKILPVPLVCLLPGWAVIKASAFSSAWTLWMLLTWVQGEREEVSRWEPIDRRYAVECLPRAHGKEQLISEKCDSAVEHYVGIAHRNPSDIWHFCIAVSELGTLFWEAALSKELVLQSFGTGIWNIFHFVLACVLLTLGIVQIKVDVFIPENEQVYQFLSCHLQCNGDILVHSQCRFIKQNAYKINQLNAWADLSQSITDLFLLGEYLE